jgi:beta-glucanase (GH16 family)
MNKHLISFIIVMAIGMPASAQFRMHVKGAANDSTAVSTLYFHADANNNWSVDSLSNGTYNAKSDVSRYDSISIYSTTPVFINAVPHINLSQWKMVWSDEFDYPDSLLENTWISQNSDKNTTIACGRWRENCLVSDGTLKLMNKGPKTGYPSPYTSGNVWSKKNFQYGYFECRYKYANANATNNSFWFMATSGSPRFEIDINEGHVPHEVTTNVHNHDYSPMTSSPGTHDISRNSAYSFVAADANKPLVTNKIRFSAVNGGNKFHIPELRIYNVNAAGYPDPASSTADKDVAGLVNYAKTATISCSGSYTTSYPVSKIVDGSITSHWVSQVSGDKWVEFEWPANVRIGCIQFLDGWQYGSKWNDMLPDFKIEYYTGNKWKVLKDSVLPNVNLATEYHTYGLEWNADSLSWYYDRKLIRKVANSICHGPSPIWLSEAILPWLNPVATEIIGTQMEIDYVRAYEKK